MKSRDIKRMLFATDLHGSNVVFKKMLTFAKTIPADLIVMGGDIAGKILIPIVGEPGDYMLNFHGQIIIAHTEKELEDIITKISNEGNYSKVMSREDFERLKEDSYLLNYYFEQAAEERVRHWISTADSSLDGTGINVLISGGNDDTQKLVDTVTDSKIVVNVDQKVYNNFEPFALVNVGFSNPTPFSTPREVQEDFLENTIEELMRQITVDADHLIFNIHVPPYGSTLDVAPKVIVGSDGSLSMSIKGGEAEMAHVGSTAVLKAIKKYQPALALFGHIHESRAAEKIGKTLCINPGSAYTEGTLNSAVINIRDGKIIGYQLPIS